jgi:uncharacterized protein (TIGR02246 family)
VQASQPQDLPQRFHQGFSSGDVEAIVSLYEPGGVIAPDPKQIVPGHAAIRAMVAAFLAQLPRVSLFESEAVQVGDLALVWSRWAVKTTDSSGHESEMNITPILVARRQPDGRWLVVIDRPLMS